MSTQSTSTMLGKLAAAQKEKVISVSEAKANSGGQNDADEQPRIMPNAPQLTPSPSMEDVLLQSLSQSFSRKCTIQD